MDIRILIRAILGLTVSVLIIGAIIKVCELIPQYQFLIYLMSFFIMLITVYLGAKEFKNTEGEHGVIVYTDYYDVFKCLSVFLVPLIIILIGTHINQVKAAQIISMIYAVAMVLHISYISAKLNNFKMLPIIILVKLSISLIWVYALKESLNPSGKNARERRNSRATAVMVLMIVTPIINTLVLNSDGKELIQSRLKGRRFSGASNLRNMMK